MATTHSYTTINTTAPPESEDMCNLREKLERGDNSETETSDDRVDTISELGEAQSVTPHHEGRSCGRTSAGDDGFEFKKRIGSWIRWDKTKKKMDDTWIESKSKIDTSERPMVLTISRDLRPRGILERHTSKRELQEKFKEVELGQILTTTNNHGRVLHILVLRKTKYDDMEGGLVKSTFTKLFERNKGGTAGLAIPRIGTGDNTIKWVTIREQICDAMIRMGTPVVFHPDPEFCDAEIKRIFEGNVFFKEQDIHEVPGSIMLDMSIDLRGSDSGIRKELAKLHGGFYNYTLPVRQLGEVLQIPLTDRPGCFIFYVINRKGYSDDPILSAYKSGLSRVGQICRLRGISRIHTLKAYYNMDTFRGTDLRDAMKEAFKNSQVEVIVAIQPKKK
jgi:hypothetical protein